MYKWGYVFFVLSIFIFIFFVLNTKIAKADDAWTNPIGCILGSSSSTNEDYFIASPDLQTAINGAQTACGSGCVQKITKVQQGGGNKLLPYTATAVCVPRDVSHYQCDNVPGSQPTSFVVNQPELLGAKSAADLLCAAEGSGEKIAPNCVVSMRPNLTDFQQGGVSFKAPTGFEATCIVRPSKIGTSKAKCGDVTANTSDCPSECQAITISANLKVCSTQTIQDTCNTSMDSSSFTNNLAFCSDLISQGKIYSNQNGVSSVCTKDGSTFGYGCFFSGSTLCMNAGDNSGRKAENIICAKNKNSGALGLTVDQPQKPLSDQYEIGFTINNAKPSTSYTVWPDGIDSKCSVLNSITGGALCNPIKVGYTPSSVPDGKFQGFIGFNTSQVTGWSTAGTKKVCIQETSSLNGFLQSISANSFESLDPQTRIGQGLINLFLGGISKITISCGNDDTHATADVVLDGGTCQEVPGNVGDTKCDDLKNKGYPINDPVQSSCTTTGGKQGKQCQNAKDVFCTATDKSVKCAAPPSGQQCSYQCPKDTSEDSCDPTVPAGKCCSTNAQDKQNPVDKKLVCKPLCDKDHPCTTSGGTVCDPKGGTAGTGISTAIGCVPTKPQELIQGTLKFATFAGGGIALLLMLFGAIGMITSLGNAEAVKKAQGQFTSAIIGLLFIIFSVLLMKIIGFDILGLPGFG